jgi:hypothetical protein
MRKKSQDAKPPKKKPILCLKQPSTFIQWKKCVCFSQKSVDKNENMMYNTLDKDTASAFIAEASDTYSNIVIGTTMNSRAGDMKAML